MTAGRQATPEQAALTVACPFCEAAAGEACHHKARSLAGKSHGMRLRAAAQAGRDAAPLGEHGRAFAERLAEDACSPRVRQVARDLLAEDDAQAGREPTWAEHLTAVGHVEYVCTAEHEDGGWTCQYCAGGLYYCVRCNEGEGGLDPDRCPSSSARETTDTARE